MSSLIAEMRSNAPKALAGMALLGSAGWMGGKSLELISPGVIPSAHALSLGLAVPASMTMYAVANKINPEGGCFNTLFAVVAGYVASVGVTNMLGFSVSVTGPFSGLTALTVLTGLVSTITIPIILVAGICLSCTLPATPENPGCGLNYLAARFLPLAPEADLGRVNRVEELH